MKGNHELLKLTANQVRSGGYDKAILAVGSCEAHGMHLAEGTDTFVSYRLSCMAADRVRGLLVLPPVNVGYSGHYDSFPFTLTLGYDTITQVIYDLLESVLRNGINRIFLMNGHDGNIAPIEIASRKIKEKYPDARIAALPQWWVTAGDLLPPGTFEVWDGLGHAGEGETSIAYHLFPQWCEPDQAHCVVPDNLPDKIEIKWDFAELTNVGNTGDATKATAEKGEWMTNALVDCISDVITRLDAINWDYRSTAARTQP
ncbi:MAG: creatininase family protein [Eubacteriales bacterium]|nr:creatininase family protein [Eubacteriales bacterium]